MNIIRKLTDQDMGEFLTIAANAYPGEITPASDEERLKILERLKLQDQDPTIDFYGLYRQHQLVGVMRFHDFTMQLLSTRIKAGGVGMVAVDLLHKKEKVARDMILYFLKHYRTQGACLALLYPFRPDFYKKMGFGYGTKTDRYRVKPASLPAGGPKEHVRFLHTADRQALVDCYNRRLESTNGLIEKSAYEAQRLFEAQSNRIVGYVEGGQVLGYAVFTFEKLDPHNFLLHDIQVKELMYETPQALAGLLAFFHTQADQVNSIIFDLQDEHLHYLFHDPRDGSNNMLGLISHECNTQGLGLMYRVIDTRGVFGVLAGHNFGGQTCKVRLVVGDGFLKENDGSVVIHFENGRPHLRDDEWEVEVCLDIADFSSLLVGAVDFKSLHAYGLAEISNPGYLETVDKLFLAQAKPVCTTLF